jgi:hypothetical protein
MKADKLPTEKEAAEIKKEIEALPHFGWMPTDWSAADDAVRETFLFRHGLAVPGAVAGTAFSSIGF